ncbi:MAG: hypothetical protein LBK82_01005 [Planctomycetaceae bacterium]|nr:hypothetical protein [Planctomycetaceae bacterium]
MTPKRKATQFIVINLIHCRLTPTQPFSERLPTYAVAHLRDGGRTCNPTAKLLTTGEKSPKLDLHPLEF